MFIKINAFLTKYENWLIVLLMCAFILVNVQGLTWGLPNYWNVDELVQYADVALREGRPNFDETADLSYPSLPKYVMYGLGKVVYGLGYSTKVFRYAARLLSVLLGTGILFWVYKITRAAGSKALTALMSALLTMTLAELSLNAHFAHNDVYVALFSLLAVFLLLRYRKTANRSVLYAAFFTIGLAASSKYPAVFLVLAGLAVWLLTKGKTLFQEKLRTLETLFISACLSFFGFAVGTPKSLLWMAAYFGNIPHTLYLLSNYNRTEATTIGFVRQWGVLQYMLGTPVFVLVILALLACLVFFLAPIFVKKTNLPKPSEAITVILIASLALDLPMMLSYDIKSRFFLSVALLLFILASLLVELTVTSLLEPKLHAVSVGLEAGILLVILYSALRVASTILLFENDARIAAGAYLKTLPYHSTLEYTLYPPILPLDYFYLHTYPIDIIKYPDEVVPILEDERYRYNQGEAGLLNRHPDYFVVDNFTYDRFQDELVCEWNQVECDFFTRLLAGETDYTLIATFTYTLPDYLPNINMSFLNPEIRVYQREY